MPYRKGKEIPFQVRIPIDMHRELKELADRNRRSMNAEVLFAIEEFLERRAYQEGDTRKRANGE